MLAITNKVILGLGSLVEWATVVLIATLVMVVFANVIARYFFQTGLLWSEEVGRLAFVWTVFLGAFVALRRQGHLAITFVTDRLPVRIRRVVHFSVALLTMAFLAALTWGGLGLVQQALEFGRVTPILGISAAWGYLSVPVAAVLMLLEAFRALLMGQHDPVIASHSTGLAAIPDSSAALSSESPSSIDGPRTAASSSDAQGQLASRRP